MNELVCNFAIVRFLPYRETGEFVNVGVVLHAPETGFFGHRLTVGKRNRRVRAFFPELDMGSYAAALASFDAELNRQGREFAFRRMASGTRMATDGMTAFRSLLRRRESLLHFADPGMRLGRPEAVLEAVYRDYVERHFAKQPDYHETVMRSRLSSQLKTWGLRRQYQTEDIVGDPLYHLTLPFVHRDAGRPLVAIKPLDLDRPEPTKIFDHGGQWVQRFGRLRDRGHLPPRVIVPIRYPPADRFPIAERVSAELTSTGVTVVRVEDEDEIHRLAQV